MSDFWEDEFEGLHASNDRIAADDRSIDDVDFSEANETARRFFKDKTYSIELTAAEKDYIWLLASMDSLRILAMNDGIEKDFHYQVRHSLRSKLVDAMNKEKKG